MYTHCPNCDTHFEISQEYLDIANGKVRCGQCDHIFNALDSLYEKQDTPVEAAVSDDNLPEDESSQDSTESQSPDPTTDESNSSDTSTNTAEAAEQQTSSPFSSFNSSISIPSTDIKSKMERIAASLSAATAELKHARTSSSFSTTTSNTTADDKVETNELINAEENTVSDESLSIEENPVSDELSSIEENPISDELSSIEENTVSDESLSIEKNTVSDELSSIEENPVSDELSSIEENPVSDESLSIEENTVSDELSSIEENPVSDESLSIEENTVSDESLSIEENTVSDESLSIEENTVSDESLSIEENTVSDESLSIEENSLFEEVLIAEESSINDKTSGTDELSDEIEILSPDEVITPDDNINADDELDLVHYETLDSQEAPATSINEFKPQNVDEGDIEILNSLMDESDQSNINDDLLDELDDINKTLSDNNNSLDDEYASLGDDFDDLGNGDDLLAELEQLESDFLNSDHTASKASSDEDLLNSEASTETSLDSNKIAVHNTEFDELERPPAEIHIEETVPSFLTQSDASSTSPVAMFSWLAGTIILIALLGVQYLHVNSIKFSQDASFRPLLETLCPITGCSLPLIKAPRKIITVNHDVRSHPRVNNALEIQLTMKNKASYTQDYPLLEITFSNPLGEVIARRKFLPDEYLSGEIQYQQGFKKNQSQEINLKIVDPDPGSDLSFQFNYL